MKNFTKVLKNQYPSNNRPQESGAGYIKKQLKLTIVKCEYQPIRMAYSRVNYYLITKSQLKFFMRPAPDLVIQLIVADYYS